MALYAGRTTKYTRSARFTAKDLGVIASVKQGVFTDDNPYIFEWGQEVIVKNMSSSLYGQVGIIVDRCAGGKVNRYKVRFGRVGVPFTQDELTAYRALPVPMWVTEGRSRDRVIVFGRTFQADDPIAARLMAREGAHKKRQEKKRITPQAAICLPRWTQTTAREAVAQLIKAKIRQDYIAHIEKRLSVRVRGLAA